MYFELLLINELGSVMGLYLKVINLKCGGCKL